MPIRRPSALLSLPILALAGGARAQEAPGVARPWQLWHPEPATPMMADLSDFHMMLLWIMTGICVLVIALIAFVCMRFRAARNPTPTRASHNTALEVAWTVLPVLILLVIAVPSFQLLYRSDLTADAEMTVKVTGMQWYWEYTYPDHGDLTFASVMVPEAELRPDQPRLLAVDNRLVLPVDTTVRILVAAGDVLHSWAVPALGVKMDGIPGRLNETWTRIEREGVYYGQCSQICGTNHAYMPVAVEAVSKERFAEWVAEAQARFGEAAPGAGRRLAQAGIEARR